MRRYRLLLCVAMCAALGLFGLEAGASGQAAPARNLFRMHFVAHSDDAYDQAVKLKVRDELLSRLAPALKGANDAKQAMRIAQGMRAELEEHALSVLKAGGVGYGARLLIGEMDFEDREYESIMIPAGRYPALRLELGAAGGRNWWCVLYPSACAEAGVSSPAKDSQPGFRSLIWDWFMGIAHNNSVED